MSLSEKDIKKIKNRFNQISEYTFITKPILGEDDDVDGANNVGDDTQDEKSEEMDNSEETNVETTDELSSDENNEEVDMNVDDDTSIETDTMEEGDEVIDVDELTRSQQATEYKLDGVDERLTDILNIVSKFQKAIELSDKKLDDLKSELERRNPTNSEREQVRLGYGKPFINVAHLPKDEKKEEPKEEEYILKQSDIDDNNPYSISKTLDIPYSLTDFIKV